MGDVVIEAPKSPGKTSAIDMSLEEPGMFESVVIINKQMKSETETLPACRSENGSTLASNLEAQEEKPENFVSTTPLSSLEFTRKALGGEILSPLQKDVEGLKEAENHSNSWADQKHAEADTACELSDPRDSVHFIDTATAATFRGTSAGTVGENSELHLGLTEAPNGFKYEDRLANSSEGNFNPTLKIISAELNKPFDNSSHCLTASNTGHLLDSSETVVSPKANEGFPRENLFNRATEALGSHTSMGTCDALNCVDVSEHQLPIQEISTAAVVSTDLDGWQRFDAEESEASSVVGFQQTIPGASENQLELWEQLLEDGLEGTVQCSPMTTALVEAEVGIESSIHDGNQFWLASPGNPFIEGIARSSNFSEADGFVTNVNFVRSQSLHDYGLDTSFGEGLNQTDDGGKEIYPGITNNKDKSAEENTGSHFNDTHSHESKKIAQQRFPSFSDIRRSSSRPRDTSFLSFKEQELAYNAHGYEAGGENWEANFDLVAPAIHEGPRSLSLPREAGESQRQGSFEAPVRSQSKLSSFLSPKLSPIVKKVASKVRTNPNQVMKDSKAVGKKKSRKWTWRCCMCCSQS